MAAKFTITGVSSTLSFFKELTVNARIDLKAALDAAAQVVIDKAVEYCPKDTGALRESIRRVPGPGVGSDYTHEVMVTAGNATAYYAVYVHEINKNYRVGGWKYLERAVRDTLPEVQKIIAAKVFERLSLAYGGRRYFRG